MLKKISLVTCIGILAPLHAMQFTFKSLRKAYIFQATKKQSRFLSATSKKYNAFDDQDKKDQDLLIKAIKEHNLEDFNQALAQKDMSHKGFDVRLTKGGYTQQAYELAQKMGTPEMKKKLATTSLIYAIQDQNLNGVNEALECGADVNEMHAISLFQYYTSLGLALKTENSNIIRAILDKNPDTDVVYTEHDYYGGITKYSAENLASKVSIQLLLERYIKKDNPLPVILAHPDSKGWRLSQASPELQAEIDKYWRDLSKMEERLYGKVDED